MTTATKTWLDWFLADLDAPGSASSLLYAEGNRYFVECTAGSDAAKAYYDGRDWAFRDRGAASKALAACQAKSQKLGDGLAFVLVDAKERKAL